MSVHWSQRWGAERGVGALPGWPPLPSEPPQPGSGEGEGGDGTLVMALLLEHEFKPLPADKQIETLPFLEAVAHLPPFFGETGVVGAGRCGLGPGLLQAQPLRGAPSPVLDVTPLPDPGLPPGLTALPESGLHHDPVKPAEQPRWEASCGPLERPIQRHRARQELPSHPWIPHGCRDMDCLGTPIVYSPVKADLTGNIKKIRAVYDSNPAKFKTLQNILEVEKELHGSAWPKTGATLALMWLKRGLKFILVLLQSISDGERDEEHPNLIRVNALKAYEIALKKYHGWMLQKLFTGSVYALPYKSDLLKALEKGKEVKEEESIEKIHQFLTRVTPILDAIYEMYTKMNAELSYKA